MGGIFSKKVTKSRTDFKLLFGDNPLAKVKVGKRSKNVTQKQFLENFISDAANKTPPLANLYSRILEANRLHEPIWTKFKISVNKRATFKKITFNENLVKKKVPEGGTFVSYSPDSSGNLYQEYCLKLQLSDYNYDTNEVIINGYTFKYIVTSQLFKVTALPQNVEKLKYTLDQEIELSSLDIYLHLGIYKDSLKDKLYEEFKKQFNIDYTNPDMQVDLQEFSLNYGDDAVLSIDDRSFKVLGYFTWKDHLDENKQPKYEYVGYDLEMPINIFKVYELSLYSKSYFIEYKDKDEHRQILWGKDIDEFNIERNASTELLAAVYPLLNPSGKHFLKALELAGYKNNTRSRRKGKKNKQQDDLITQLAKEDHIKYAEVGQYLNISYFFYKDIRENRFWQGYLRKIITYLESIAPFGTYHSNAPQTEYSLGGETYSGANQRLRIQGIKRFVKNMKCTKKCFLSTEPQSGAAYLYINMPDYSASTQEEADKGIFYNFMQYGLNLSYWYSRPSEFSYKTGPYGDRGSYHTHKFSYNLNTTNFYNRKNFNVPLDSYHSDNGNLYVYGDSGKMYWGDPKWTTQTHGPYYKDYYLTSDISAIIPISIIEYEKKTGNIWGNTGNYLDTATGITKVIEEKDQIWRDYSDDTVIEDIKVTATYHYLNESGFKYDDTNNVMPNGVNDAMFIPLMPKKLWLKIPYASQLEVYPSTIYLTYKVQWEEKKGTFIGKVFGAVLIVVGAVIIYASWGSATQIGSAMMSLGIGLIAGGVGYYGGMYNIKWLQIAAYVVQLAAAGYSSWTTGFSSLASASTNVIAIANTLVQGYNLYANWGMQDKLAKFKNEVQNDIAKSEKERQELLEETENKLDLSIYDINIAFDEAIDDMFMFMFGEYQYRLLSSGKLYDVYQDIDPDKLFNRFKN